MDRHPPPARATAAPPSPLPALEGLSPPSQGGVSAPLWLLGLFAFSGTLAMHIFVPALTMAGKDLGAGNSAMQMTVSLYVLGLAVGQLVYGPLSDRFGRRPVLTGGLVVYTVAGLGTVGASFLHGGAAWLIAARLFQALGGCAGQVLGRAIVRDTSKGSLAAKRMARMNMLVMLAPALAPLAGGLIAAGLGWRAILMVLMVLGLVNLALVWRLLPETHAGAKHVSVRQLASDYKLLLGSRRFLSYTFAGGCATTSIYAFIAAAPFIFVHQMHRPEGEVGLYLTTLVSGMWLGNFVSSRLIDHIALPRMCIGGNLLSLACCTTILVLALTTEPHVLVILLLMFFFTIGSGFCSPGAMTLAVNVNPSVIGSASGLYGSTQMAVGALCSALAGLGSSPLLATALVLVGACLLSQCLFHIARHAPLDENLIE